MNGVKKYLALFSRIILGLVFFIAGLLKLMDPVGAGLIMKEYFNFFHIGFLNIVATPLAYLLILVETGVGIALLTGVYKKITYYCTLILVSIFTLITLVLLIFNPSMDCGCFGEAIKLTHLQSFIKNIVLCLLAIGAYFISKEHISYKKSKYSVFWIVLLSCVGFAIYSNLYIPLLDFTPFTPSSVLQNSTDANSLRQEEYVATYIYKKNGQEGRFTLDRMPDSTWTFVRSEVVKKQDNIHKVKYITLSFTNNANAYCDSLAYSGNVFVISVYNPHKLSKKGWSKILKHSNFATQVGMTSLILVASTPTNIKMDLTNKGLKKADIDSLYSKIYYADYKTLISLNRSNGGATYFSNGRLIEKWGKRALPTEGDLAWLYKTDATYPMLNVNTRRTLVFESFLLYSLFLIFLF